MVKEHKSEDWEDTFTNRIGKDQATDFDPSDVDPEKRRKYRRLRRLNSGEYKNRSMRDREQIRRRDNLGILDSLASKIPLTKPQKERALEVVEELPLGEMGLPAAVICFAVVAMVRNQDTTRHVYHPTLSAEQNPARLNTVAESLPYGPKTLERAFDAVMERHEWGP